MRRVIANPRSVCSLGLDSATSSANSGAPPPGYTSQRDTNSSIAVINEYEEDDGEMISNCSSSPPLPPMESCRDVLHPMYILPSPYSTEDLSLATPESTHSPVESHEQDQDPIYSHRSQAQSCPHGYTHTHSQCTPVSSFFKAGFHPHPDVQHSAFPTTTNMPPVRSNSYYPSQQHQLGGGHVRDAPTFYGPPVHPTDNLFGSNAQSRSSLRPYHLSSMEEHPPTLQAGNPHPHQQTTLPCIAISSNDDYNLSSPPYRQNVYPPPCADIRILTYPPADEVADEYDCDYEEYGYEEDGEGGGDLNEGRSPLNDKSMRMMMMMNSTATILSPSEEPSGYRSQDLAHPQAPHNRRRHPNLMNGVSRESTTLDHRHAATTTTRDVVGTGNMNLTKTATKFDSRNPTKPSAKDHSNLAPLPAQAQPTNYVHLSRKCSPLKPTSKFWRWRKIQPTQIPSRSSSTSSSSAITGTFIINPELNIPPGLLNAMEDPVFRSSSTNTEDTGDALHSKISRTRNRRTNLRLEVENGGIDVDIRLSPSSGGACIWNRDRVHLDTFCDTHAMAQAHVSANTTAIAFSSVGIPPSEAFEKPTQQSPHPHLSTTPLATTRMRKNPDQPSTKRKEAILRPAVVRGTSAKRDKKQSRPTTIHLQIKQAHSLNMPQSNSVGQKRPSTGPLPFPLIARIHAPNPRPPFHLFASTIDIPDSTPDSTGISKHNSAPKEPQSPTGEKENQPRTSSSIPMATSILNNEASGAMNPPRRIRRSLSKSHRQSVSSHRTFTASPSPTSSQLNFASPLYLHLPRTFHGPLTIHISSGDVGAHLRLSEGLEREVALIRESEFGRGYFVGTLGSNVDVEGEKGGGRKGEQERDGGEEELGDGGGDHDTIFIHPDENRARGTSNNPTYHPLEQEHDRESVEIKNKTQLDTPNDNNNNINHVALSDDSSVASSLILLPSLSSSSWYNAEWYGDRIEIRVGSGEVYLQFEDEVDPFSINSRREIGFWKRKLGCLGSFLD